MFPSVTRINVHCYTTDLATMELEMFLKQHRCEQQSTTHEGGDFYMVRGK
jgi:hypothetical protein